MHLNISVIEKYKQANLNTSSNQLEQELACYYEDVILFQNFNEKRNYFLLRTLQSSQNLQTS
jgi:hypothetical protein